MMRTEAATNSSENATGLSIIVPSKAEGIALCAAFILTFIFIVVGNLLTIVLFAIDKSLRKRSLFLVINMAFADLMLGTLVPPMFVYVVGFEYQFWSAGLPMYFTALRRIVYTFFSQASLTSAAFISCERFYATYWPRKYRRLSLRAYRIVICLIWVVSLVFGAIFPALKLFISSKHAIYPCMVYALIVIFIICGCNIGIWRKFQHGGVATQQPRRASQSKRLTKTLMFVSTLALLSWLPLIISINLNLVYHVQIPSLWYYPVVVLNISSSFVNPVLYALRIPEFTEALVLCCSKRSAAPIITATKRHRKIRIEPGPLQLAFEQEVMDTKL